MGKWEGGWAILTFPWSFKLSPDCCVCDGCLGSPRTQSSHTRSSQYGAAPIQLFPHFSSVGGSASWGWSEGELIPRLGLELALKYVCVGLTLLHLPFLSLICCLSVTAPCVCTWANPEWFSYIHRAHWGCIPDCLPVSLPYINHAHHPTEGPTFLFLLFPAAKLP